MQNKKQVIISGLILFIMGFFGKTDAQESFYVYFMQNGKRVNVKESKTELKKQTFDIYLEYTAPMDLLLNASLDSKTWQAAKKGKLLYTMPVFNDTIKERPTIFDFDGTLMLNPEISFLWKKDQTDTIKNLQSKKGRRINVKKIKSLYSVTDSTNLWPKDFDKDLYLVFIYAEKDKNGECIEIQREVVKINWVKKYKEETKSYERKKKVTAKEKVRKAKQNLKRKQKSAEKEEKRLKKLEKDKQKRLQREKKKAEKDKQKKLKKQNKTKEEHDG